MNIRGFPNIVFVGKMGSGKTTATNTLIAMGEEVAPVPYRKLTIAAPLKRICAEIWGPEEGAKREKLQSLGVAVRDIDVDAWANVAAREAQKINGGSFAERMSAPSSPAAAFVCDDCRFPNEVDILRGEGAVFVKIECDRNVRVARLKANGRLQDESQLEHISETALDNVGFKPDYVIDNTSITPTELHAELIEIINKERGRK